MFLSLRTTPVRRSVVPVVPPVPDALPANYERDARYIHLDARSKPLKLAHSLFY